MKASLLMQCIITKKQSNQIKLTRYNDTKKRANDSQIVRATENLKLIYGGPGQQQASGTKNREYDHEIPQSQTADNPMAPRGRATQPSRDTRKTN